VERTITYQVRIALVAWIVLLGSVLTRPLTLRAADIPSATDELGFRSLDPEGPAGAGDPDLTDLPSYCASFEIPGAMDPFHALGRAAIAGGSLSLLPVLGLQPSAP
jgi:hypothetical protein